jgi:hypothetical protein
MQANADFDPVRAAKRLIRESRNGALGSLLPGGAPYASLVTVSTLPDGSPLLLLSKLARHTTNIARDNRVSLLLHEDRPGDPLEGTRISLSGTITKTEDSGAPQRFLAHHPAAETYAGFADFGFWRIEIESAHLVAGFGRIVDLKGHTLRTETTGAEKLLASAQAAIEHMNEDHLDAIGSYATKLLGTGSGEWRIVSLDPEGCDLMLRGQLRRLEFPSRVISSDELRKTMVALMKRARGESLS